MENIKTICMFCSMGCGLTLVSNKGIPSHIEYDIDNPINKGSLCPRGNSSIELVKNMMRLNGPKIRINGTSIDSNWDEALGYLAKKIEDIKKKYGANSIGIVISPASTNEEVYLSEILAKTIIKTSNFDIAFTSDDNNLVEALDGYYLQEAPIYNISDVDDADCLLIIGDQLSKAPCSSKNIMNAKYNKKGTKVIVLEPKLSNTAWFASAHIQMKPGTEWLVLAGMIKSILDVKKKLSPKEKSLKKIMGRVTFDKISEKTGISTGTISNSANEFAASKKGVIMVSTGVNRVHPLTGILCKILATISKNEKGIIPFFTYINSNGANFMDKMLKSGKKAMTAEQMIEAAVNGKIKAIISFGVDLVNIAKWGSIIEKPLKLELLATADIFLTRTTEASDIVLPAASIFEKEGSMVIGDNSVINIKEALPPLFGSKGYCEIIQRLALKLGKTQNDLENIMKGIKNIGKQRSKPNNIKQLEKMLMESLKQKTDEAHDPYLLVPFEDIVHHAEGSYTNNFYWPKKMCGEPFLEINKRTAIEIGVDDGDKVVIRSKNDGLLIGVKISDNVPGNLVFIPAHFIDVRNLFGRNISDMTGRILLEPVGISIKKAG